MKKGIFFIALMTNYCFSATCPSINMIQQQKISSWTAYDALNNKPISKIRLAKFKNSVKKFSLAEAVKYNDAVQMRCFYQDKFGSNMQTYLARDHFGPTAEIPYWYQVSGAMQCAAGINQCFFIRKVDQAQFALNSY